LKIKSLFIALTLILAFHANLLNLSLNESVATNTNQTPDIEVPVIKDENLKLSKVIDGLEFPTSMAFLGPDDILVLEKNKGTVQRIVNGKMLQVPVLDANVSNYVERGMLGIAIKNEYTANKDYENNNLRSLIPTYVYLYYTESSDKSNSDKNGTSQDCTDCIPAGHRLYRYELRNNMLIEPKLLLDLPSSLGRSGASHIGGVLVIGPDHNIYLTVGDGESCENNRCKDGVQNKTINSQTSNVVNGSLPVGRGGILRVSDDKDFDNNDVLGNTYPLNMYYAYGLRNSFGIDFDPLTGKLWDTENGPGFGDEINLVEPGFNSGWIRIQGVWPINDNNLLDSTPKNKGYFGKSISENKVNNLVTFDRKGVYSHPEFTWNITVGVTAIKFFSSDKLGEKYENDLFVGDIGNLYHFDLKEDRTKLDLKGKLSDKVANHGRELEDLFIGRNFGTIVDIETSPDGYLYVLSYETGTIFKITMI
jgi:glucose/arabinose dehydrogenase